MATFRSSVLEIKKQTGQTTVEYILLLSVVVSLFFTLYNSATLRKFLGEKGIIGRTVKENNQFGYRHAFMRGRGADVARDLTDISTHPSYKSPDGDTRFFT